MTAVAAARAGSIALGTAAAFVIVYTCITDGSPFRKSLLIPWMKATLVDFYVLVTLLSAWIIYKESSWLSRLLWILLLICFGSVTASYYVAIQLFKITTHDPVYAILFRDNHARLLRNSDTFLTAGTK